MNEVGFMGRAIELARMAMGSTSPNPAVGAVVVKNGVIVGEGYTQPPGSDHAEVVALRAAGELARGATLYVTLEPCAHYGRTPPCTKAIIDAGIREVHLALLDPNPLVCGKGMEQLRQAGIDAFVGDGASEACEINEAFFKAITEGTPFIIGKWAMSLDGRIATRSGDSKWITGRTARAYAHYLRAISDAVMVGVGTVLTDDPALTVRIPDDVAAASTPAGIWPVAPRQPLRVVVDSQGRIPLGSKVLEADAPTLVATTSRMDDSTRGELTRRGAEVVVLPEKDGRVDLAALTEWLVERHVTSVLIEGGSELLGAAFDARLIDKVCAFVAPKVIGGRGALSPVGGLGSEDMSIVAALSNVRTHVVGEDVLLVGYTQRESGRCSRG